MTDGQVREQVPDDLELVDVGAADDERASADRIAHDAAQCTFDGLLRLIAASPQSAPLVLDLLAQAQDWPLADKIAQHIRALLQPETPVEGKEQSEHLAGRDEARPAAEAPAPVDPIRETVVSADAAATRAAHEAGSRVIAESYEGHRILAMAAIETMIAHATVALTALRWEAENIPLVANSLIQAERQMQIAGQAVDARLQLADVEERVQATRAETARAATAPAAA
jgi:hypothetical protein